jgi:DNA-binding transcriptional regulator YiaG
MEAKRIYKTPALQSVHEMMEDSYNEGDLSKEEMKEFDVLCLEEPRPNREIERNKI